MLELAKIMDQRPVRLISNQASRYTQSSSSARKAKPHCRQQNAKDTCEKYRKGRKRCHCPTNSARPLPELIQAAQSLDYSISPATLSSAQPNYSRDQREKSFCTKVSIPEERNRYTPGTPISQLCDECQRINFSKILDLDAAALQQNIKDGVFIKNLGPGPGLEHAAKSSCALCCLFSHTRIDVKGVPDYSEYHLRAYSVFNRFFSLNLNDKCPQNLALKDMPCLAIVPSSTKMNIPDAHVKFIFCHAGEHDQERIFTAQPVLPSVDFSRVMELLNYCRKKHNNLCRYHQIPIKGMKLINCHKVARTAEELDIILVESDKVPSDLLYVALSYVWGQLNIEASDQLPQVIADAITVTQKLGYQYLWIDQHCINQSDPEEVEYQVDNMNAIYKGADITIIAAAGKDASFGLPGIGDSPRIPQPAIAIRNIQLVSSMYTPRCIIESSIWNTRAWTFQEGKLSRRRLVFTDYEIYFECNSMHWRESWVADLDQLHSHGRFRSIVSAGILSGRSTIGSTVIRSPFQTLRRYYEIASEYSTKEFSHDFGQKDSLKAFTGVMNDLEDNKFPIYQLWGVPYISSSDASTEALKSFVASLLWRHKAGVRSLYRKLPERRTWFPSWSFVGWAGEILFPLRVAQRYRRFISMVETISLETDPEPFQPLELVPLPLFREHDLRGVQLCNTRALHIDVFVLLLPEELTLHSKFSPNTEDSPNMTIDGFKAIIYLSKGSQTRQGFRQLFSNGRLRMVLIAREPFHSPQKRQPYVHFMIIEPHESSACRVGLMVVKADFEIFKQHFKFEKQRIRLI